MNVMAEISAGGVPIGFVLSAAYIALEIVGVLLAADAIMHGRTPQGTVAWVGGLIAFPLISVPTYLLFGSRRIAGYVRARRRGVGKLVEVAKTVAEALAPYKAASSGVMEPSRAELLGVLPVTRGNQVKLLIDGDATFSAIFGAIDGARSTIAIQFYIVRDDRVGRELRDKLIAARKRGVRVYFLYDAIGSPRRSLKTYFKMLRDAGVEVEDFRPSRAPRLRVQLNFRNHRKTVVVDGVTAFVGGINVGDEYLGRDPRVGPWRDTHVALRGPAALAVQVAFVEDWYCCTRRVPDLMWAWDPASAGMLEGVQGADARVAVIASGPADEMETCLILFSQLIHSAKKRLWIATPYFVPDETLVTALQSAVLRGVDVRLIVPRKSDNTFVDVAARAALEEVMAAELTVYEHGGPGSGGGLAGSGGTSLVSKAGGGVGSGAGGIGSGGGFMHQKVLLSDGVAAIGTANMDNRSIRINFELTTVSDDPVLTEEVAAMLERDMAASRRLVRKELTGAPWIRRFARRLVRLAAPIL